MVKVIPFDLQLPHPPNVGDLPSRVPNSDTNRRRYTN